MRFHKTASRHAIEKIFNESGGELTYYSPKTLRKKIKNGRARVELGRNSRRAVIVGDQVVIMNATFSKVITQHKLGVYEEMKKKRRENR
jgi:hypothetical protein